jgi:hypothetical protein
MMFAAGVPLIRTIPFADTTGTASSAPHPQSNSRGTEIIKDRQRRLARINMGTELRQISCADASLRLGHGGALFEDGTASRVRKTTRGHPTWPQKWCARAPLVRPCKTLRFNKCVALVTATRGKKSEFAQNLPVISSAQVLQK